MTSSRFLCLFVALGLADHALAQQLESPPGALQKTVQMLRATMPPVIDGVLDDAVWADAAFIDDLHQETPIEYSEPSEHTEVYLLYDDDALYIGARLFDSEPERITAQNLRQSDNIGDDDRFYVTLDPFNSQRSGYYFGVNANSVRHDGLYRNVSEFYSDWDGIYYAQASRFDGGWVAEIEIPFKTISFDPNTDRWGLNFSRGIVRKNENIAWVSRNQSHDPSSSGLGIGFEGLDQGLGLDVMPSVSATRSQNANPAVPTDSDFEPSLDVAYRITSSLNASLTINTDFAATEVDDRQVNLTRFGLFFPEKRDFFLREADIFEFGRIGAQVDAVYAFNRAGLQNGRPFFSRRIGLNNAGQVIGLEHGAKLSGRVGRWELGALSIRQDDFGSIEDDSLSVVRAKLGVLAESSVGVIATQGDPNSNTDNASTGFDFLYRNTRLPGGRTLEAEVWAQHSDTENRPGDDSAAGFGLRVPSATGVRAGFSAKRFEANFNPALGFVIRSGVEDVTFDVGYTHRPTSGPIQSIKSSFDMQRVEWIDGGLQTLQWNIRPFALANHRGDAVDMIYRDYEEVLRFPWQIAPGVIVPAGRYQFADTGGQLRTGAHRRLAGMFRYVSGSFYGGDKTDVVSELTWRPSPKFRANLSYNYSDIDLPGGRFDVRLVRAGIDYIFSSTLSLVNLIQYDNRSETVGLNMRLHWIPQAGRELYFVVNHNLEDFDRDNRFHTQNSDMTAKISYTFRF